jgi:hypothetical protein
MILSELVVEEDGGDECVLQNGSLVILAKMVKVNDTTSLKQVGD